MYSCAAVRILMKGHCSMLKARSTLLWYCILTVPGTPGYPASAPRCRSGRCYFGRPCGALCGNRHPTRGAPGLVPMQVPMQSLEHPRVLVRHLFLARSAFETRAAFIHVLNLLECLGILVLRMPFVKWFGNCWTVLFPHSWSSARSVAACCSAFGRY